MNQDIPTVNCPAESGVHKVVQFLAKDGKHYLRINFGMEAPIHHIGIVSAFFDEAGIEYITTHKGVFPKGKEIEIEGAGKIDISLENRTAELFGESTDYKVEISQKGVEAIRQEYPGWTISHNPRRFK